MKEQQATKVVASGFEITMTFTKDLKGLVVTKIGFVNHGVRPGIISPVDSAPQTVKIE